MITIKYKVLVVEDDYDIVEVLKLYLVNDGFEVISAPDGAVALDILKNTKVDLAIFDIMMPNLNGYDLTKQAREFINIPIIILSAKALDSDKILGLNLGADDYLTKPFRPLELVARVNSCLRRYYKLNNNEDLCSEKILVGDLCLDTKQLELTKRGEKIAITATEYKILAMLMRSPGQIYTKVQLYENINGEYFNCDSNTIMVHISKLRDKIEDDSKNPRYIKTVRGLGYKFENQ